MVTLQSLQAHTGLTHLFNFLTLSPERQNARMSEKLKTVG